VRGVPEAMTRTALRQVREQNRGRPPIEGQYMYTTMTRMKVTYLSYQQ